MTESEGRFSERIPELLELLRTSDVSELEIENAESRVRLRRGGLVTQRLQEDVGEPTAEDSREPTTMPITSPLVGTFFRSTHGAPPLAEEGSTVSDDSVVGIVEALNVLTEVEAGCSGVVTKVLIEDGKPVEYGQPLFEVALG